MVLQSTQSSTLHTPDFLFQHQQRGFAAAGSVTRVDPADIEHATGIERCGHRADVSYCCCLAAQLQSLSRALQSHLLTERPANARQSFGISVSNVTCCLL